LRIPEDVHFAQKTDHKLIVLSILLINLHLHLSRK